IIIEADRGVVVLDRRLVVMVAKIGLAAIVVVLGIMGVEADRRVVVLDRRIVVPIFKMSFATILEEINFFRIEGDRLVIDIDRPIPVVPSEIGAAAFKKVSLALCIITDGRTTYRFSHELRGRN